MHGYEHEKAYRPINSDKQHNTLLLLCTFTRKTLPLRSHERVTHN